MLDIPPAVVRAYHEAADQNGVPLDQRPHSIRWLRYDLVSAVISVVYPPSLSRWRHSVTTQSAASICSLNPRN